MSKKSQTAIERYQARRAGRAVKPLSPAEHRAHQASLGLAIVTEANETKAEAAQIQARKRRADRLRRRGKGFSLRRVAMVVAFLLAVLGPVAWQIVPHSGHLIQVAYEIDVSDAPGGALTITLVAEGRLPRELELEAPPGAMKDTGHGREIGTPTALALAADGSAVRPLPVVRSDIGWRVTTDGATRVGLNYRVDLQRSRGSETDIRRHVSTPVAGGVRAAGYEVFLLPVAVAVDDITVMIHNPDNLPVLVPWPALVRGGTKHAERSPGPNGSTDPVQQAHLGLGQGFRTEGELSHEPQAGDVPARATPIPANLFYHPQDLDDLNNALLVCGQIRTASVQARDCVVQFATDRRWLFRDQDVLELVRRIARTEIGFFGSAPTPQITVLLAANEVTATEGFDVYGIHTGSSVLVLLNPNTTWGVLEEQAASVIAHEMFHGWLGEAIPQANPATLWFTEGATTWYAARMLTAAGVWTPDLARQNLLGRLERDYVESDLLGRMTVAEAAADVTADADQVRYAYAGGVAVCLALDDFLTETGSLQNPLDEVLRHLYKTRNDDPLSRESIEAAVLAVTGVDCHDWLEQHVYGRSALPPLERLI